MITLPEKYLNEMKELLQDEFDDYLESFNQKHAIALRVNEAKISVAEFQKKFPYSLEPVPWCHNGFYIDADVPASKHPYYFAGLYYLQEASAMLPAEVLPIEQGDCVLDICAAPGGKSTELGVKLHDTGVLFANDISYSRCQALLKNLERFGIRNAYVTSETPEKMVSYFTEYFDKILIDAPCSGEGMFRKDKSLIQSWIEHDSSYYVPIQKSIIDCALQMLKPGGMLVYSTCTFSKREDEEIIAYAIEKEPSLRVVDIPYCDGFVQNAYGTKLFPHRVFGEGHFVSLLQKDGEKKLNPSSKKSYVFQEENISMQFQNSQCIQMKERTYAITDTDVDLKGLRIMRSGVLLGENKKNRFAINDILPMYLKENDFRNSIHFALGDIRIEKYLKGETVEVHDQQVEDGMVVVCVQDYPLGFAKCKKGVLKNKYPKSWIMK